MKTTDRCERGQALVEFALVLPILVWMIVGGLDLGRIVLGNDLVTNAAREAARYAIVHGSSHLATAWCPAGPMDADIVAPSASTTCPYPSPSTESIKQVARDFAAAGGLEVVVTVCYGADCSGDTSTATNKRGTPVTVTVRGTVTTVAAQFLGISTFTVSSSSTMVVNN